MKQSRANRNRRVPQTDAAARNRILAALLAGSLLAGMLTGCGMSETAAQVGSEPSALSSSESAEPTVTSTPEETVTPTPEETAAPTPEETAAPTPEETAAPTPEETAAPTPEETAAPTPEETAAPTPEPTFSVEDLIVDHMITTTGGIGEISIYYPEINLDSTEIAQLNDTILNEYCALDDMEQYECLGIDYQCAVNGNILSVVIIRHFVNDNLRFYTVNVDVSAECIASMAALDSAGGYASENSLYSELSEAISSVISDTYREETERRGSDYDESYIAPFIEDSTTQENLEQAQFYLNDAGQMCAAAMYYYPAGGGIHAGLINLVSREKYIIPDP